MKNKKGYISIEAIISYSLLLMFLLLIIAFFTYGFSGVTMADQSYQLRKVATEHGGLRTIDIETFISHVNNVGYMQDKSVPIEIYLEDENGNSYLNIDETSYLSSDEDKTLTLKINIPANNDFLDVVLLGFDVSDITGDYYSFSYLVQSERY